MKKLDLSGQIFGRLTVITEGGRSSNGRVKWLCVCECGNEKEIDNGSLKKGVSTSCGCYNKELLSLRKVHGAGQTVEYKAWSEIKRRCFNQKRNGYESYGGRGITVCERWLNSFEKFLEDMGLRPSKLHSVDRIDNNLNYEPTNCKWSTRAEQNRNTRRNINVTINGETKVLKDWADAFGLEYDKVKNRVRRLNWSIEEALEIKKRGN